MIIGYFNSQPHEEADGRIMKSSWLHIHFNSQPHEEADRMEERIILLQLHFNSQPHEEADGESWLSGSNCI